MKDIKLIRLEMENFKKHKHLRLDFSGRNAVIFGKNGTGKSSVYDSLMWLLFGKNSEGKSDFEVKPLGSDGNVLDHNALTSVEAVLDVSGEEVTLQRTYREKWETRRGSSEAVFTGHTSEYSVDGVPVKKNAFQQKVSELVRDEDTFRLLTSITYFPRDISWQERRAILFEIVGVMDDAQILATDERFVPLVESMGRLSLEDYKKKILAEKKKFTGAKTEIPARISECSKTIEDIEGLDFAGARAQVEALNAKKDEIAAQILALDSGEAEKKALEIRAVQLELKALEGGNRNYREAQKVGTVDVQGLNLRLTSLQTGLAVKKRSLDAESSYISQLEEQISSHRKKWITVNAETFAGGNCPTCGQNLPQEQLQAAVEQFEADKQERLHNILSDANNAKNAKAMAEDRFSGTQAEIMEMEAEIASIREQIAQTEKNKVEPKDMEDYSQRKAAILSRMDKLNADLHEIQSNVSGLKMKLRQEMSALTAQIDEHTAIIQKESLLDYSRQRIGQLREDAKRAAQQLEAIEKMLFLIETYTRYKTQFVEDSINGMFWIARFRLFREQANGGVEDVCDVVYDGVAYNDVNTGMKINLGIDIINTLSAAYGVRVPLFVDNAESITDWEKFNGQLIRLEARKEDKELRVSYEN